MELGEGRANGRDEGLVAEASHFVGRGDRMLRQFFFEVVGYEVGYDFGIGLRAEAVAVATRAVLGAGGSFR